MLPENKNAILYGAGGSIGGAVVREFAREGVKVFFAGRTHEKLEVVARDIEAAGGSVEVAVLDALEEQAVDEHALVHLQERFWAMSCSAAYELAERTTRSLVNAHKTSLSIAQNVS